MTVSSEDWEMARQTVRHSFSSSLHCTITSVNADGSAHATPVGSVLLTAPGYGFFFDIFNRQLAHNLDLDPRVTILAVDSSKRLWLSSLLRGHFTRPPGVRLVGEAGPRRLATAVEVQRWHRAVRPLLRTRGGQILWGKLRYVRDLSIETTSPINLGKMTGSQRNRSFRG
jgi:hypothetical protein